MPRDRTMALTAMTLLLVALGIGRFSFTPLLPLMHEDQGLSLVGGGWLASMNNLGYLIGALGCTLRRTDTRRTLRAGLVIAAVCTLAVGLGNHLPVWMVLRLIGGAASAALVIHGIAFGLSRMRQPTRTHEALIFTGPGLGMVLSGILVAGLRPLGMTASQGWLGFGLLALLASAAVWRMLGHPPQPHAIHAARALPASGPSWALVAIYSLLGFAYIIPATFLPVIAEQGLHMPALREWFWPVYGCAAVLGVLSMPLLPRHLSRRRALAGCCLSLGLGIVLCLGRPGLPGFALGTLLCGGVSMPVVLLVMDEARRLHPHDPSRLIAVLTAGFSIGQIAGPLLAGVLAERLHGFTLPLVLALAASVLALAACAVGRRREAAPS